MSDHNVCSVPKNSMGDPYQFFSPDKGHIRLSDVSLCGSRGIVIDSNSKLVKEVLDEHIYWLPNTLTRSWLEGRKFKASIVKERLAFLDFHAQELRVVSNRNGKTHSLNDSKIYVDLTHPFGWYAFGHLHDSLQRLYSVKDEPFMRTTDICFLVSRCDRIVDFKEHLACFSGKSVSELAMLEVESNRIYKIKHYIKPSMPSVYTTFRLDVYLWVRQRYRDFFAAKTGQRLKLYLSRNHVKQGSRGVKNEAFYLERLKMAGYQILLGNEPLGFIVNAFSSAELVFGAHGSLFANTIFCDEDCRVFEFCPENRIDHSFYKKTKLVKDYKQIVVPADSSFNIEIDFEVFLNGRF